MSKASSAKSRAGRIDEPPFRLRPAKPKPRGGEAAAWSKALTTVLRYARQSRRKPTPAGAANGGGSGSRNQRCAVRITYSANKVRGQWRAHGRYIARETVTGNHREAGFGSAGEKLAPAETLAEWQKAGDPRLWKLILSPEFGAQLDLQRMTREVMARMERDLGTKLEWVGVAHFNTEHPHVHVALRGVRADGSALGMTRDYIRAGVRRHAAEVCTRGIGLRRVQPGLAAIGPMRWTSTPGLEPARATRTMASERFGLGRL